MRDPGEVGPAREVLAEKAVGVSVAAPLPGAARIAEVDLEVGGHGEAVVASHLLALIPRQRASQLYRQLTNLGATRSDA